MDCYGQFSDEQLIERLRGECVSGGRSFGL